MHANPRPCDQHPQFSVVVPCYNESAGLQELHRRVSDVCRQTGWSHEIILVDDGSRDDTAEKIAELAAQDVAVRGVSLSRNFGHQAALSAGYDHACGQAVIVLDADLQHPPEIIPRFLAKWQEGYDVVYAYRQNAPVRLGYRFYNWLCDVHIPAEAADFRLMDRQVVEAFAGMSERQRFVRGMIAWLGFRQIGIPYDQLDRHAGRPTYNWRKRLSLRISSVLSFSTMPLRITVVLGLFTLGLGILYALYILLALCLRPESIPSGWPATVMTVLILGGVQLVCLGMVAEYVGRIYEEVKRRPLYVVKKLIGTGSGEQRIGNQESQNENTA